MKQSVKMSIPADANYMDLVRGCLLGIASKLGFSYEDIEDMKVAVSEACSNAVIHGRKPDGSAAGDIDIQFEFDDAALFISVINYGIPFAHLNARLEATGIQGDNPEELRVGGLGIYLMEALMDEVHMSSDENQTEVKLMKYRI